MPRSKTTETRNNVHKGVRKLSKKTSKKGSKNNKNNKNINTTTEEMLDILNSDNNVHNGNNIYTNKVPPQYQQYQQNVDPYMINYAVPTDANGNMFNTNKIGSLLGGVAQINSSAQYVPPMDLNLTEMGPSNNMPMDSNQLNSMSFMGNMMPQMDQNMIMPQMDQNMMMPQMQQNMMMPQMQQNMMMPQMQQNMMPQAMDLKNIAALSTIPRIA
jgi:hypothetical protein